MMIWDEIVEHKQKHFKTFKYLFRTTSSYSRILMLLTPIKDILA